MRELYDTVIVGGGPAGCTAALYCAMAGRSAGVLEKLIPGGQMATAVNVDNCPGAELGVSGVVLAERMKRSAESFGAEFFSGELLSIEDPAGAEKVLKTGAGEFRARTVVLAMGAAPRTLGLEGEERLRGAGVSYCAACDGQLFSGKTVAVVGGGNSAAQEAAILDRVCGKVTLIHRRDSLRADKLYREAVTKGGVELRFNSRVTALLGRERLEGLVIENVNTGERETLDCDGIFIAVGRVPESGPVKGLVELDPGGYILADETTKTSVPGVFAAGDIRTKPFRQIVTAASDGAVAARAVEDWLTGMGM